MCGVEIAKKNDEESAAYFANQLTRNLQTFVVLETVFDICFYSYGPSIVLFTARDLFAPIPLRCAANDLFIFVIFIEQI